MLRPRMLFKAGIYQIRQISTGKRYVGSSAWLSKRCWTHLHDLGLNRHHCEHLQRSWNKRSGEGFVFEVLLYCDAKDAIFYEQRFIDKLKPEYNTCPTAGTCLGKKLTEQHKSRLRAANLGSKRTPETRAKMSAWQKGRKPSAATMAGAAEYRARPENSRVGIPLSSETRSKQSAAAKKKILTPEHLAKLEAARRAKATLTAEQVRRIRKMSSEGRLRKEIATLMGISLSCIGDILRGDTYRYVED